MRLLLALCVAFQPLAASAQEAAIGTRALPSAIAGLPLAPSANLSNADFTALDVFLPNISGGLAGLPAASAAPHAAKARAAAPAAAGRRAALPAPASRPARLAASLGSIGAAILRDRAALPNLPAEALRDTGEEHLAWLLGAAPGAKSAGPIVEAPAPEGMGRLSNRPAPQRRPDALSGQENEPPSPPGSLPENDAGGNGVRWMLFGTAAMKIGMETVKLAVPLFVLQALGGAAYVPLLAIVFGLAQILSSAAAGPIADRIPAAKVLAGAIAAGAALAGLTVALGASGLLSPWMVFPAYAAIGGALGAAETARRLVAPLLLGRDKAALAKYNARVHIFYESSGVAGALLTGLAIGLLGPLKALVLIPPAFLLAAFCFGRVRHAFEPKPGETPATQAGPARRLLRTLARYAADARAGAGAAWADPRLRWAAAALVLPAAAHRLFEDVLLPVYAAKALGAGALSTVLVTASDLGELVGAALLLKLAERFSGSFAWVRWSALGLLAVWSLSATTSLPILLALIMACSMSWAASDLSLMAHFQSTLPGKTRAAAMGVLLGATTISVIIGSLLIGLAMYVLPLKPAFAAVGAAATALALLVLCASRRMAGHAK